MLGGRRRPWQDPRPRCPTPQAGPYLCKPFGARLSGRSALSLGSPIAPTIGFAFLRASHPGKPAPRPRGVLHQPVYALIAAMNASAQAFPTIALIGRHESPGIAEPLSRLAAFLAERGHRVLLDAETARLAPLPGYATAAAAELGRQAKLAIVVGGDGTMLSIARQIAPFDVPLIGINQGRLG